MKKKQIKVHLIGKDKSNYKIKFPYLDTPVVVDEYYYNKMLKSNEYHFHNSLLNHSTANTQFQ